MYLKCSIYRGGTSRGVFFKKSALKGLDTASLQTIFKTAIDCYNQNSIDGLGGGISSTNKVCIVSKSNNAKADINWHFYQIGVHDDFIDDSGTCGNLIAAAASFGINEKLVQVKDGLNAITIFNENIKKYFEVSLYVKNGKAKIDGEFALAGVTKNSSPIYIKALNPGGEQSGDIYPLQKSNVAIINDKKYKFSLCDFVNPCAYILGDENLVHLNYEEFSHLNLIIELNKLKKYIANQLSLAQNSAIPRVSLIFKPVSFYEGEKLYKKEDYDILVRAISLNNLHKTCPLSGLYNLACLCSTKKTIANEIVDFKTILAKKSIKIGHFGGISEINFSTINDKIKSIDTIRTAREIMNGTINI